MKRVAHIVEQVQADIAAGLRKPGERLLSVRAGAQHYGVSKNTMSEAYDRLVSLGTVNARAGSGYYVAEPARKLDIPSEPRVIQAVDTVSLLREQLLRHYSLRVGDGRLPPDWAGKLDGGLRPGGDAGVWGTMDHGYGNPWGFSPLRERLAAILQERGIQASGGQILLTYGANHALDLLARHLLAPGDVVLVDSPGYYPLFGKLTYSGVRLVGVRRTPEGPDVEDLEEKCRRHRPAVFFTQTLAHNPTGTSATLPVCHRILTLAQQYGFQVVEDDPFADILPADSPRLATLDQLQHVIYVGTFSKTLSAGLRVGYVAGPERMMSALCDLKMLTVVASSDWAERLVYSLMLNGQYLKHIRRLRSRVERAQQRVCRTLSDHGLELFSAPTGGFYLWGQMPSGCREADFVAAAAERSIFIAPGSVFYPERQSVRPAMRINIAYGDDPRFLDFLSSQFA